MRPRASSLAGVAPLRAGATRTFSMGSTSNSVRLAKRLIELAGGAADAERDGHPDRDPAALVAERLAATLTTFTGTSGSHALLRRAQALAAAESPPLAQVEIAPDGTLTGLAAVDAQTHGAAGRALVGALLGLLSDLIGEALLLRLVAQAWPEASDAVREGDTEDTA